MIIRVIVRIVTNGCQKKLAMVDEQNTNDKMLVLKQKF
jgi:hypothetical protein